MNLLSELYIYCLASSARVQQTNVSAVLGANPRRRFPKNLKNILLFLNLWTSILKVQKVLGKGFLFKSTLTICGLHICKNIYKKEIDLQF